MRKEYIEKLIALADELEQDVDNFVKTSTGGHKLTANAKYLIGYIYVLKENE